MRKRNKLLLTIFIFMIILSINKKSYSFSPEVSELIQNGTKYLFNLKWKESNRIFRNLMTLMPNHPVSYFYMAFSLFITDMNSFDQDEKLNELDNFVVQGVHFAKNIENPNKYDRLYTIAINAMKAFIDFRLGKYASALGIGLRLLGDIQKLYLDFPDFEDGKIGVGTVHLLITQMPGTLKTFLSAINLRGSRELAVKHLSDAAEKGTFFSDSARSLLSYYRVFFLKKTEDAKKDLETLMNKYPRNFFFYLNHIYTFYYEKKFDECYKLIEKHKKTLENHLNDYKEDWHYRFDFLEAQIRFNQKQFDRALELFQSIIKNRQKNWAKDYYCIYSILYRGLIYDIKNNREMALKNYYLLSRNLDKDFERAKNFALKHIKEPFKPKEGEMRY